MPFTMLQGGPCWHQHGMVGSYTSRGAIVRSFVWDKDCLMKKWSCCCGLTFQRTYSPFEGLGRCWLPFSISGIHPRRLTWNLKITQLKRKIIFQTIIFKFHVNIPGCMLVSWDCCCLPGMNFVFFPNCSWHICSFGWSWYSGNERGMVSLLFYGPFASERDGLELDYKITIEHHLQKYRLDMIQIEWDIGYMLDHIASRSFQTKNI